MLIYSAWRRGETAFSFHRFQTFPYGRSSSLYENHRDQYKALEYKALECVLDIGTQRWDRDDDEVDSRIPPSIAPNLPQPQQSICDRQDSATFDCAFTQEFYYHLAKGYMNNRMAS